MDEHGTGIEDMVQDFDDARDSEDEMEESAKAFYEMLESSKRPLHEHTELCQLDAIAQFLDPDHQLRKDKKNFTEGHQVLKDGGRWSRALDGFFPAAPHEGWYFPSTPMSP
ncbi:hypothetical protein ZWY2020_010687 [Hordeum vulgare]|nr:hypothetical protein ZWY2020_010687 [Hordeum vulgare]